MPFQQAKITQAHTKFGIYGGPGSGKTMTALIGASTLAPGNVYVFDTEHGTDPFAADFNFQVLHTRSITEILAEIPNIPKGSAIVIDQLTHIWDSVQETFIENERKKKRSAVVESLEKNASLPWTAWRIIKPPYHRLITTCLYSPLHVFLLGRMATEYKTGPNNEPLKVGERMDAEKSTPHEPHILIKMERQGQKNLALVEKARGVFKEWQGRVIENPDEEWFIKVAASLKGVKELPTTPIEDQPAADLALFPGDMKANSGQLRVLEVLATKGGIDPNVVAVAVENATSAEAQALINEMNKGNFETLKAMGGAK